MRHVLFTLTHCVSDLLVAHLHGLRAAWAGGDFFVLVDARVVPNTSSLLSGFLTARVQPLFYDCYTDRDARHHGAFDLVLAFLSTRQAHYDSYFYMESDVYVPPWIAVDLLSTVLSDTADLFVPNAIVRPAADWRWLGVGRGCRGLRDCYRNASQNASVLFAKTLLAAVKMSAALVRELLAHARSGRCAYLEAFVPTVAARANLTSRRWPERLWDPRSNACASVGRAGTAGCSDCPTDAAGAYHPAKMCASRSALCAPVQRAILEGNSGNMSGNKRSEIKRHT